MSFNQDAAFPRPGPVAQAEILNRTHATSRAEDLLADVIGQTYHREIALVSSFGADSAVLLHMVSQLDPAIPVLMLETGMLFEETLDYQQSLAIRLGLTDVRLIRPDGRDLEMLDPTGDLYVENADGCCYLRKTLPLRRALEPFAASISGRKRHQGASRSDLPIFEPAHGNRHIKINPLAAWSANDLSDYLDRHALPRHPLVARGYLSIGCAPCTTPVRAGEDSRAGRWRGQDKTECGIHFDGNAWVPDGRSDPVRRSFV